MALRLPPKFVNTPAAAVYSDQLSDRQFRSLVQIRGLCWENRDECTPPCTIADLMAVCNKNKTQMYDILRELREAECIRIDKAGLGRMIIFPLRWEPSASAALDDNGELSAEDAEIDALIGTSQNSGNPENTPQNSGNPNYGTDLINGLNNLKTKTDHKQNNSPEIRNFETIWSNTLEIIKPGMQRGAFSNIFSGSTLRQNGSPTSFVITVRTKSAQEWLDGRLVPVVERALGQATGEHCTFTSEVVG